MLKTINGGITPTRGSKYSACIDLYAREDVVIGAGETVKVPLGVCIDLKDFIKVPNNNKADREILLNSFMKSHYLQLEPRSSLRAKGIQGNTGIIDLDYKDEIMIILSNPIDLDVIDFSYRLLTIGHECAKIKVPQQMIDNEMKEFSESNFEKRKEFKISKGDKIAQIMLCEHKTYEMGIDTDEERTGGFGSTGN